MIRSIEERFSFKLELFTQIVVITLGGGSFDRFSLVIDIVYPVVPIFFTGSGFTSLKLSINPASSMDFDTVQLTTAPP